MSLPDKAFPVSWDQFHRDARALARLTRLHQQLLDHLEVALRLWEELSDADARFNRDICELNLAQALVDAQRPHEARSHALALLARIDGDTPVQLRDAATALAQPLVVPPSPPTLDDEVER